MKNTSFSRNSSFRSSRNRFGSGNSSFKSRGRFSATVGRSFNRSSRRSRGEQIDISKFVKRSISMDSTENNKISHNFADFRFCKELQFNLDKRNYQKPTPVQDQAILPIMNGKDLIGLADTGSGKTAAFLLPLINKIYHTKYEKVLIIAPTRELAIQIDNELRAFSSGMRIYSAVCVGGMPIGRQIQALRQNPNFVIGTPGRLRDLSCRGLLKFNIFQNIVLDEVDRMLDMGFVEEISLILNTLPEKKQALFFSATIPEKIRNLVNKFLVSPITVAVKTGDTAANVLQDVVRVSSIFKIN
ncbi:MAG: DEAD/DEAH box helicase-like protein [Candidatus Berkelbacteria bacterium Athens1014_28]|uniref:DEAD/DEAH box helicase-like protein n=1 Tax=Candidatus Berkelbacteria bacterium Athens1014_28 TaxID=2017145 RepID=A0A554LKY1_9BACT|nr:MAG: DEAD/DEAH box helicase-like protein [Candidatus Berkelbacteria bacterium Athens1014_28]